MSGIYFMMQLYIFDIFRWWSSSSSPCNATDTVFRWSQCHVEKFIDRHGSSSLSSLKVWFLVNSSSLIIREDARQWSWCRGEYIDLLSRDTRSIYLIFEDIIFISSSRTISNHWWSFKIVFSNVHLSIIIGKVSVVFLNMYILQMIFVRRIELSEIFIMIYDNYLYDWMSKRIEDPRVIHHQKSMIYESRSISIRILKTYW